MPQARKLVKNIPQNVHHSHAIHAASNHFPDDESELLSERLDAELEFDAMLQSVPVGSVSDIKKVHQHNTELLLHKLGQRLAFERASVRLYEALIFKCLTIGRGGRNIVSIDQLRQFRDEEVEHSLLLKTAIEALGFDPDVCIPDADPNLLSSLQIPKVFTKKDTSILQCLESVQIFATNDNAEWHTLHGLFTNMGLNDLADEFNQALKEDSRQLETISRWIYQLSHV